MLSSCASAKIYQPVNGSVSEGDSTFYLIDVTRQDTLHLSMAQSDEPEGDTPTDEISVVGIYDPLGEPVKECSARLPLDCKIYNPVKGTWLVEVRGDEVYSSGDLDFRATYVDNTWHIDYKVYSPDTYHSDIYTLGEDSMQFLERYISTGEQDHLGVVGMWDDYSADYDLTIISPNLKTSKDISEGDQTDLNAYYLAPGREAEGRWLMLLRSIEGQSPLTLYSNYDSFGNVGTQQLIEDEIKNADESKEYPIEVTDTSMPLAISVKEIQSGDSLEISEIFDPSGKSVICKDFGTGCAIQDPEEGIWLLDISPVDITGDAPYKLLSTHRSYEPKDYSFSDNLSEKEVVFYETYVKTSDKEHMVLISDWDDATTNIGMGIVSANVETRDISSSGDDRNVRLYSLSPGNVAEGIWVFQMSALEGSGMANISSNYNFSKVAGQDMKRVDDIAQDGMQEHRIDVGSGDLPLVISLLELQSGDEISIGSVVDPDGKSVSCEQMTSGCAIQDPASGIWTVEIKGETITGRAPFTLASTYSFTDCGDGICEAAKGENCRSCRLDCACTKFERCNEMDVCESIAQGVNKDDRLSFFKENLLNILILLAVLAGAGYKIYRDRTAYRF